MITTNEGNMPPVSMSSSISDNFTIGWSDPNETSGGTLSCWDYWQDYHYPRIITSYPVYIQERALDKGKQAYEISKMLHDKKLVNLKTVKDFTVIMDELLKIL